MRKLNIIYIFILGFVTCLYGQESPSISYQEQIVQNTDSTLSVDLIFDKMQFQSPVEFVVTLKNGNDEQVTGDFIRIGQISGTEIIDRSIFSQDDQSYYFNLKPIKDGVPYTLVFIVRLENGDRQMLNTQKIWRLENE